MHIKDHVETPFAVAVRVFGATGALLIAMLLFLHPDVMLEAIRDAM